VRSSPLFRLGLRYPVWCVRRIGKGKEKRRKGEKEKRKRRKEKEKGKGKGEKNEKESEKRRTEERGEWRNIPEQQSQ
jgi:hypothetical protein